MLIQEFRGDVKVEKAAIYCRLSKEDQDKINQGDDSASIQNQKLILIDYAIAHQFAVYDIYSDDDYSGLDSDRPDFNRLLADAGKGCFQIIICKTQSRFTRDMELVEKYIHGLFPAIGIRFIGVVDNVDTDVKGNKKARQINGLINEWYCEDLSENIRSVFRSKMEKGQFLGSYAAYGYKKSPEDNHKLIIDEEAALVVRKIFRYAVQGLGNRQICDKLYEEGIPTPSVYKKNQGFAYQHSFKENDYARKNIWGTSTIQKILSNRMYTGDMVQGRQRKVSYKSRKMEAVPESEWIIVPDCQEPIIDRDTFGLVQELRKGRRYAASVEQGGGKQVNLLAGKIKCRNCGSTLVRCNGDKKYVTLYCQLYKRSRKEECSPHSINYNKLMELLEAKIRDMIKNHVQQCQPEEGLIFDREDNKLLKQKQSGLLKAEEELKRTQKAISMLYIDRANQVLSEEEYMDLKGNLTQLAESLNERVKKLEAEIQVLALKKKHENWEDLIPGVVDFEKLDHELINEFVEYIEVGEKDSEKNQEIIIHWRF